MSSPILFPGGFTVLMAVYHGDDADLFERAVRSVFANTLLPNAFLLVVDGPIHQLLAAVINRLEAEFSINVLYLPENQGLARALNAGVNKVKTEWIVRADADDINMPERFECLAYAVASTEMPDLVGSAIVEVDKDGNVLGIRRTALTHHEIVQFAKYRNPFNHMAVAYKSDLARECGGYPQIHLKEDYGLWALMISKGARLANSSEVLVKATAGRDMYKRRGGLRYAKAEIDLQLHLVSCGIKGRFSALSHGIMRSVVFLMPPEIRGFIYEKLLRVNQPESR